MLNQGLPLLLDTSRHIRIDLLLDERICDFALVEVCLRAVYVTMCELVRLQSSWQPW